MVKVVIEYLFKASVLITSGEWFGSLYPGAWLGSHIRGRVGVAVGALVGLASCVCVGVKVWQGVAVGVEVGSGVGVAVWRGVGFGC